MKTQIFSTAIIAAIVSQASGRTVERRATGPVGYGEKTTGGAGGTQTTVTTCAALTAAVVGAAPKIIYINGIISSCGVVDIGNNTSILGKGTASGISDGGFRVKKGKNVIFQNLKLGPGAKKGDLLALDRSTNVWIDHNEFKGVGLSVGRDDYDGLLDISHASDFVTVSWNKFSDHWKGSLVGHSDNNAAQDTGKLHVTYHHNSFTNVNSRLPSLRFGTGHIYNNYYTTSDTSAINSRMGAQVLAENNVFNNVKLAMVTDLDSDLPGFLCDRGNVLTGTSTKRITQTCSLTPPYSYKADSTNGLASAIASGAGVGKV